MTDSWDTGRLGGIEGDSRKDLDLGIENAKRESIAALRKWQGSSDIEIAHGMADEILCGFLRLLGHGDLVDEWEKVEKWYA